MAAISSRERSWPKGARVKSVPTRTTSQPPLHEGIIHHVNLVGRLRVWVTWEGFQYPVVCAPRALQVIAPPVSESEQKSIPLMKKKRSIPKTIQELLAFARCEEYKDVFEKEGFIRIEDLGYLLTEEQSNLSSLIPCPIRRTRFLHVCISTMGVIKYEGINQSWVEAWVKQAL